MREEINGTNAEIFAAYAGFDIQLWSKLIGSPVSHPTLNDGKIIEVKSHQNDVMLCIAFEDSQVRRFLASDFPSRFIIEELPFEIPNLEEIRQTKLIHIKEESRKKIERRKAQEEQRKQKEAERLQREKESHAKREFEELKNKYGIVAEDDTDPTSPLFLILKKCDEGEDLKNDEIDWLKSQHYYEFTISYLIKHYEKTDNPWDLIQAAKLYRITNQPQKALALTENLSPFERRPKSALYTNRGAAYKDIGEYEKARRLAKEALEYQSDSFYAYNLLGAICYKMGDFEKGDEHFEKAVGLGSSSNAKEYEIRTLLKSENKEYVQKTVNYLLEKDSKKYSWAKYYLTNRS